MNNYNFIIEKLLKLDKRLIYLVLALFVFSLVMLYSAAGGSFHPWVLKQLTYFILFFPLMIFVAIVDIRIWAKLSYWIYLLALILLILVELFGHTSMGATRWLRIGRLSLQPSELMKICLVMGLAKYFHSLDAKEVRQNKHLIIPLLMIAIPFALIIKQPDLGTSLILAAIGVVILFTIGIQLWKFAICGILGLSSIPFIWKYFLRDYQKKRIMTFFNPDADPLGAGYNISQSKIAIGSGGFFGKGLLKGTQGQLAFLPEKQTDFIFTMITEELGFLGGMAIIVIYSIIIGISISIITRSRHTYSKVVTAGVASMIFFHAFINIGMVMGILPVVGAPLPLLSYGGTITMITLIGFGLLLNADLYRQREMK